MKVGTDSILMGAWADVKCVNDILDIGTGTGVIALMLAQRTTIAHIDALEIDPQAAEQAAENVAISPWPERIQVWPTAVQTFTPHPPKQYDLIISNPPFFMMGAGSPSPSAVRQQARHTDHLSHLDLITAAKQLLAANGRLALILPAAQGAQFVKLAAAHGLFCTRQTHVRPLPHKAVHRWLIQLEWHPRPCVFDELTIEYEHHHYTEPFRTLVHPFYLHVSKP